MSRAPPRFPGRLQALAFVTALLVILQVIFIADPAFANRIAANTSDNFWFLLGRVAELGDLFADAAGAAATMLSHGMQSPRP